MNCFQRRMLMKGMGRHCPIRLSLLAVVASLIIVVETFVIAQVANYPQEHQELKLAVLEAQKDRDELLAVLEGRRLWITADGKQYARVKWVTQKEIVR